MREKLIELIQTATYNVNCICVSRDWCDGCPAEYGKGACKEVYVADHLIANGVTISNLETVDKEWIPVSDRLPEKGKDVLVYTLTHDVLKAHCYGDRQWFAHDGIWRVVTHWMPLPEPPKEV